MDWGAFCPFFREEPLSWIQPEVGKEGVSSWQRPVSPFWQTSFLFSLGLKMGVWDLYLPFSSHYTHTHTCSRTHTCARARTHAHVHTHMLTRTHAHTHTCSRAHMLTRTHAHVHTHEHIHTCSRAHTCAHVHTHMLTCIHMHTHTHALTHTHGYAPAIEPQAWLWSCGLLRGEKSQSGERSEW